MSNLKFGDIVNNGWASDTNPTKICMVLHQTARIIYCCSTNGESFHFSKDSTLKLAKIGSIFEDANVLYLLKSEQSNNKKG